MDAIDLAILREMSRDKVLWWGSLDPRLSSREIADRIGEAESTVRARVKAWEKAGFLLGFATMPNPALFGASFAGGSIRVDDRRAKARVLEDLALVDGMVLAQDHVGPWIGVAYINEAPSGAERRSRLVARLPGVNEVTACKSFRVPPVTVTPTTLDWRILRALSAEPRAALSSIATRVGISTRTLTRRYGALVEGNAVWSIPLLDFTRYEGAVAARFIIDITPNADPKEVGALLRDRRDDLIQLDRAYEALPEFKDDGFDILVHAPSVGTVDEIEKEILALPGVGSVEVVFPRRLFLYATWFNERVAAHVIG